MFGVGIGIDCFTFFARRSEKIRKNPKTVFRSARPGRRLGCLSHSVRLISASRIKAGFRKGLLCLVGSRRDSRSSETYRRHRWRLCGSRSRLDGTTVHRTVIGFRLTLPGAPGPVNCPAVAIQRRRALTASSFTTYRRRVRNVPFGLRSRDRRFNALFSGSLHKRPSASTGRWTVVTHGFTSATAPCMPCRFGRA